MNILLILGTIGIVGGLGYWKREWIKKNLKKIGVAIIGTGLVYAAVGGLPPTIPSIMVNGQLIEFVYTDDNTNEDLIIRTNSSITTGILYVMVENKSGTPQDISLMGFFKDTNREIRNIGILEKNVPYEVQVPQYVEVAYDCRASTTPMVEKLCTRQELTEYIKETRYKDEWQSILQEEFKKVNYDNLAKDITTLKSKKLYEVQKRIVKNIVDIEYFKIEINHPLLRKRGEQEEFFLEAIGSMGAYGHLDPFLSGWAKRVEITIDTDNIDDDLAHFPLLLTLGTSIGSSSDDVSFIFDELTSDANRKKIAVTKSDETTEMYVEIERWDDANETAVLWISKSDWEISSTSDTTIFLYYDSSQSDNTTYVADIGSRTEVWDSNFEMVYHMDESSGSSTDSTSNNKDGTFRGALPTQITGQIGKAQDLEAGSTDYIEMASLFDPNANDITVEAWVKNEDIGKSIFLWTDGSSPRVGLEQGCDRWIFRDDSGSSNSVSGGGIGLGVWYYCAGRYDVSETNLYLTVTTTEKGPVSETVSSATVNHQEVGRHRKGGAPQSYFDGIMDEVRISKFFRADAWLKASYYSGLDNLISWGSEELAPTARRIWWTIP